MPLTPNEARELGMSKLNITPELFAKCFEVAREMGVTGMDLGPMTLALAKMGVARAFDPREMESEMYDALALVSRAENEWRLEKQHDGIGRQH